MVPALQVLFTALEAVFALSLWAMRGTTEYGYGNRSICRRAPESLPFDGLCSHSPLVELPVGGESTLTAEELEAKALDYVRRHRERDERNRERKLRENPEGQRAHEIKKRKIYVDSHPGAADQAEKRNTAKAVKEKKHTCDVCQHSFTKKNILRRHLRGRKHANKLAALEEAAHYQKRIKGKITDPNARTRERQRASNRKVKEKRFFCHVCQQAFIQKKGLEKHLAGSKHAAKAALLEDATFLEHYAFMANISLVFLWFYGKQHLMSIC